MLKKYALMAALVLVLSPAAARADWLFTPNLGSTFGGDASGNEHFTYGASIGWMGAGIMGWEADLSYTPEFFEPGTINWRRWAYPAACRAAHTVVVASRFVKRN